MVVGMLPTDPLTRGAILPEGELPDAAEIVQRGRERAAQISVGPCPFLAQANVACEAAHKRQQMARGIPMLHAQVGFRDPAKTRRAYREIHARLGDAGRQLDRYGICLDWSMGYPAADRPGMPRGTGLILEGPEEFARLTDQAPVAAHFGDFVLGMPSAVENTEAALLAGSTAIGNLGQYFNFRLPHWTDDVRTTAATLEAIALTAAQPVQVLVHSNLDDGFAALFHDLASAYGAVLLERYIVDELVGGHVSHCYGHTYAHPQQRLAFQRALRVGAKSPGTMVYGNTTSYREREVENYAALAAYMVVDIAGQRLHATGHALNPVPVTEAMRIPDIDEIVDAHLFCHRLIERTQDLPPLLDLPAVDQMAGGIVAGGKAFAERVLAGLERAGIDIRNPLEMLLAIRRVGAKRLEQEFGATPNVVESSTVGDLRRRARACIEGLGARRTVLEGSDLRGCVATTDVHEYGKLVVEATLRELGIDHVDAGVSVDPDRLAAVAQASEAQFIALSTYNGVALDYLGRLETEMQARDLQIPVFVGGKLNQVPKGTQSSLPVDVTEDVAATGAVVCRRIEDMLLGLADMVEGTP